MENSAEDRVFSSQYNKGVSESEDNRNLLLKMQGSGNTKKMEEIVIASIGHHAEQHGTVVDIVDIDGGSKTPGGQDLDAWYVYCVT